MSFESALLILFPFLFFLSVDFVLTRSIFLEIRLLILSIPLCQSKLEKKRKKQDRLLSSVFPPSLTNLLIYGICNRKENAASRNTPRKKRRKIENLFVVQLHNILVINSSYSQLELNLLLFLLHLLNHHVY
jgi:hypothetical protein